jgi:hypothetical protein
MKPFVTRFRPLRYNAFRAGQMHVRAAGSYVKALGGKIDGGGTLGDLS